jgi:hypothetical protein
MNVLQKNVALNNAKGMGVNRVNSKKTYRQILV